MKPEQAIFIMWAAFALCWLAAAGWNARAQKRPRLSAELRYLLVMVPGFALLVLGFAMAAFRHAAPAHGAASWIAAAFIIPGFAFAWWGRLHIGAVWSGFTTRKADHPVVNTGPYALVRHPIYAGWLLSIIATSLANLHPLAMAGALLIVISVWMKARFEEAWLRQELAAGAYDRYAARVPMLVPGLRRWGRKEESSFSDADSTPKCITGSASGRR